MTARKQICDLVRKPKTFNRKITIFHALRAAGMAGFDSTDIREINAAGYIGKYFEQEVIKTIASSVMMRTMQQLKDEIERCSRTLALPIEQLSHKEREIIRRQHLQYLEQQISLTREIQKAAALSCKTSLPPPKPVNPSFGAHERVTPQVNIGIKTDTGNVTIDHGPPKQNGN